MPAVRLVAEGIGPFERLDLDFSDGRGNPHLGPHILAGVNGSGKSTALRALAWVLDAGQYGFPYDSWRHSLTGHGVSRAALLLKPVSLGSSVCACVSPFIEKEPSRTPTELTEWVQATLAPASGPYMNRQSKVLPGVSGRYSWLSFGTLTDIEGYANFAAYTPSSALQYLPAPDLSKTLSSALEGALGFESTVRNEVIHAWLLGLHSRRAIAKEQGQSAETYTSILGRFQEALNLIFGQRSPLKVEIDPQWQLLLHFSGSDINFSQLPDGARNTIGWLADFMMRQELNRWSPEVGARRPGILLIDEIDAHLHPRWQRQILPALRKALPDVQIIVASHSPFVISSCAGARVHVLEVDGNGRARANPPVDAPFGQSINATLKDIFGVESRFDLQTEKDLDQWNELKKKDAVRRLSGGDRRRLESLTRELEERSEELRSIVGMPPKIPRAVIDSLLQGSPRTNKIRRVAKR